MTDIDDTPTNTPEGTVEAAQTDSGTTEPDTAVSDMPENDDVLQDDPDDDAKSSKLRKRAQAAEQERDQLAATLTATRQAIVDRALTEAGMDTRMLSVVGVELNDLVDEGSGLVDAGKLAAVIDQAQQVVTPKSRRPAPNPLVGRGGGDRPEPDGLQTFREAFGAK